MFVLDTNMLTHLLRGNGRVTERMIRTHEEVVLPVIARIEALQGRFAFVMKAADGESLLRAQFRLAEVDRDLQKFVVLPIDAAVAAEFDLLRQTRGLKKVGRADLLVAAIALANRATLVTRNLKDFRKIPRLLLENWVD